MPRTVFVALDESKLSETALPFAVALARQSGATLKILSVLQIPAAYTNWIDDFLGEESWDSKSTGMIEYLERIASRVDSVPVEIEAHIGLDAAIEIDEAVTAGENALLVITTNGYSGIKRLILGSIASRLVHIATYPLVVVPAEADECPDTFSRILLPLDGSSFSEYALGKTLELLDASPPTLHLLHVIDEVLGNNDADTAIRNRLHAEASSNLTRIADDLASRGYEVHWEIDEALNIHDCIAAAAERTDSDLIAMATHGRTGFSRFFLGSVADALVRTSTKPVLLIHPSEEVVSLAPESRTQVSEVTRRN